MKQKREGQGAGHGSGSIMPRTVGWPPPTSPSSLRVSGVRTEREQLREARQANAKLGDFAKALKEDRDEKRAQLERNKMRIRALETEKLELENAARRGVGERVKAAMSRLFGVGKRGKR